MFNILIMALNGLNILTLIRVPGIIQVILILGVGYRAICLKNLIL